MKRQEYIYIINFREVQVLPEIGTSKDFYATSLAAIYKFFRPEQVGVSLSRLWQLHVSRGAVYEGRQCTIRRAPLLRTPINETTGS